MSTFGANLEYGLITLFQERSNPKLEHMKTLLLSTLSLCIVCTVLAQTSKSNLSIKGVVADSITGKPLAYVTVALQDVKTRLSVKSVVSREDGSFEISAPAGKSYQLLVDFAGYGEKSIPVEENATTLNLGTVVLATSTKQLNEVTVVAQKPLIKRDIDAITYDVTADPESPALSALDMMRKVPLLSVDASDNIQLKGSANYKILINGKESALMAKNPSDVLRSMPATNIERIEVITTPPAKYDAEGLAGIINIITKKKIGQGYNIGVNGRYNSVWGPAINVNGTYKQGKFGLSGYAGYNERLTISNGFGNNQTFFADNSNLVQSGTSNFSGHHKYADLELSYEFDSLNLLTGSFTYYHGSNAQSNSQLSTTADSNQAITQQYKMLTEGNNSWEGLDMGFNFQHGFKSDKNRLLTLSYKYNYSPNTQGTSNQILDTINYQLPNYKQYNDAGNRQHTLQLDYVHPYKKLTLEGGAKAILRNNYSNFQTSTFNDTTKEFVQSPTQTNDFNYHQDIFSLYNSYQAKLDKWNLKAGLRLEHTSIKADFVSVSSTVNQDYNNLIPSISIQRGFKTSSLTLGYTDRISRPGIWQLNPFVDLSNPKFVNTGNPNLKPELNHTFELNFSSFAKTSVNIGLSYAFSNNSIQNVTSLRIDSNLHNGLDTVTFTTWQNLGSNSSLGINFNTSFSIIKDLTVSLNGQISHVWLKGTFNGVMYHNDGYTGRAFMNAGYKFGKEKTFRFGIDAGFFSGDINLQGESSPFVYTSYVLSKTFMDKKLTISLVANNPYTKYYTFSSHTTTPDFYQYSYNREPYRTYAIRVNFKFGKLTSDIKRNQRGIENDDTKGGKSSGNNN